MTAVVSLVDGTEVTVLGTRRDIMTNIAFYGRVTGLCTDGRSIVIDQKDVLSVVDS